MNLEPKKRVAEPKSETQSKLERGDQEVYEPEGHRNTFFISVRRSLMQLLCRHLFYHVGTTSEHSALWAVGLASRQQVANDGYQCIPKRMVVYGEGGGCEDQKLRGSHPPSS